MTFRKAICAVAGVALAMAACGEAAAQAWPNRPIRMVVEIGRAHV